MSSIRDRAAATTREAKRVRVPEWDVDVEVRSITITEYRSLKEYADDETGLALRLIVTAVYDPETGAPAFTDDDLPMLAGQGVAVIETLLQEVIAVSGLDRSAVESGKDGS